MSKNWPLEDLESSVRVLEPQVLDLELQVAQELGYKMYELALVRGLGVGIDWGAEVLHRGCSLKFWVLGFEEGVVVCLAAVICWLGCRGVDWR